MGRSKTDAEVLRPEVRLLKDHAATRRLLREARARDVSLAQHIHDLLVAREAALNGQTPGDAVFRAAAEAAASAVEPLVDHQTTGEYRRDLVRAVVRRALEHSQT